MKHLLAGLALAAAAAAAGIAFQDPNHRLDLPGHPADARVLEHRDSAYTSVTWVAAPSNNFQQLRFFDKVEGGICLDPGWAAIAALPGCEHWRATDMRGPGPLNNSAYISLFPVGVLMNARLGPQLRQAAPRVLVVGLGSGIGIAQLAHHFPQAAVTVVDIDPVVLDAVRAQYPMLAWLEGQRRADGEPRLRLVVRDARQYVRYDARRAAAPFDLVVLDAYTAGSTIPPHLMTREFFAEIAAALAPDGLVLANIISSYGEERDGAMQGEKHRVLGGALRSLRAAGLEHAWCLPILQFHEGLGDWKRDTARNVMVVAGRASLAPAAVPAAWERLKAWVPFPELPAGRWVSRQVALLGAEGYTTTLAPMEWIAGAVPALDRLPPKALKTDGPQHALSAGSEDSGMVAEVAAAVRKAAPAGSHLAGWDGAGAKSLLRRDWDWVLFPRETWRIAVLAARDALTHDGAAIAGPPEGPERAGTPTWRQADAPLFTDQRPNADIVNH